MAGRPDNPNLSGSDDSRDGRALQWPRIERNRSEIAAELESFSAELDGVSRQMANRLALWFRGSETFDNAVYRADVLAICAPLLKAGSGVEDHSPMEPDEIARAVRIGFASIVKVSAARYSLPQLVIGPLSVLTVIFGFSILISVGLLPFIEQIYTEASIEPSILTGVILKLGVLMRKLIWFAVFVLFCLAILIGLILTSRSGWPFAGRTVGETWLDRWFKPVRVSAANWAWHMARLAECGVDPQQAVTFANGSQSRRFTRKILTVNELDSDPETETRGGVQPVRFSGRLELLNTTLDVTNQSARIELLREVALYYWSANRSVVQWWSTWLMSALFWFSVFLVALFLFAVCSPILSITSRYAFF